MPTTPNASALTPPLAATAALVANTGLTTVDEEEDAGVVLAVSVGFQLEFSVVTREVGYACPVPVPVPVA